jgi:hypothetical protein
MSKPRKPPPMVQSDEPRWRPPVRYHACRYGPGASDVVLRGVMSLRPAWPNDGTHPPECDRELRADYAHRSLRGAERYGGPRSGDLRSERADDLALRGEGSRQRPRPTQGDAPGLAERRESPR